MTLSELAYQARVLLKLLIVVVGVLVMLVILVFILLNVLKKPVVEQAFINPVFGNLDQPVIEYGKKRQDLNYSLDTTSGNLPDATSSAFVYFIPESKSTLAYLTQIKNLAESFGFDTEIIRPVPVGENWVKYEDDIKGLDINVKNYHFYFYYKPTQVLQQIVEATPEAKFTYIEDRFTEEAKEALRVRNAYPLHLASGKVNLTYQKYDLGQGKFMPAQVGEVPQAIRIDYFRKESDQRKIVNPKYFESQNYIILSPLTTDPEVVEAKFSSFNIFEDNPGVYPLITIQQAWEQLLKNNAQVVMVDEINNGTIKIKDIFLAYYDPESYQPYFQPVFVFIGDQNFKAYLPAIKPKYYSTN